MRRILHQTVLTVFLLCILFISASAQTENFQGWTIPNDISGGALRMAANDTRVITIKVNVRRERLSNGSFPPLTLQVQLVRLPTGTATCNDCTSVSPILTITNTDFPTDAEFVSRDFSVTVSAGSGSSTTGVTLRSGDHLALLVGTSRTQATQTYPVVVTPPRPAAPTALTVTGIDADEISLLWTDNSTDEEAFIVYRSTNGSTFSNIVTLAPNTTIFVDENLTPQTTYHYYVTSRKNAVDSYGTNTVAVTTLMAPGDTFENPFVVGTLQHGDVYENLVNTADSKYLDNYGGPNNQPSADVFYKFTLTQVSEVEISTCKSPVPLPSNPDTYMHLLGSGGYHITTWDQNPFDNGCGENVAFIKLRLKPGDYYAVMEGWATNEGNAYMVIRVNAPPPISFQNVIDIGDLTLGDQYFDTKNTNNYTHQVGAGGKDVVYMFQLLEEAYFHGRVQCCNGLAQPWNIDPYMYLTNSNGQIIAEGDNYDDSSSPYVRKELQPGTYYAIAENKAAAGNSTMSIIISENFSIDLRVAVPSTEAKHIAFVVAPNPATDVLRISVGNDFAGEFVGIITEVFSGRQVGTIREVAVEGVVSVDIAGLPEGFYVVKTAGSAYGRFVKQ